MDCAIKEYRLVPCLISVIRHLFGDPLPVPAPRQLLVLPVSLQCPPLGNKNKKIIVYHIQVDQ